MSLSDYPELLEDIADLQVKARRKDETPDDSNNVLAELRDAGQL